jgi:preprotein translocase subunit SecF
MEIFKKTPQIKFLKYKLPALILTAVIVLAGMLNIFVGHGLKLGVDFGAGTLIRVVFKTPMAIGDVRSLLAAADFGGSTIQETGKSGREFQIRSVDIKSAAAEDQLESHQILSNKIIQALRGTDGQSEAAQGLKDLNAIDQKNLAALLEAGFPEKGGALAEQVLNARKNETNQGILVDYADLSRDGVPADAVTYLKGKTYLGKMNILSRESVGPQVGQDLRKKAVLATIWSLIGMLIYIAVRFKVANGVADPGRPHLHHLLFVQQPRGQPAHHRRAVDDRRVFDQRHDRHLRPDPGESESPAKNASRRRHEPQPQPDAGPDVHHLGHGLPDGPGPVPLRRPGHQRFRLHHAHRHDRGRLFDDLLVVSCRPVLAEVVPVETRPEIKSLPISND